MAFLDHCDECGHLDPTCEWVTSPIRTDYFVACINCRIGRFSLPVVRDEKRLRRAKRDRKFVPQEDDALPDEYIDDPRYS